MMTLTLFCSKVTFELVMLLPQAGAFKYKLPRTGITTMHHNAQQVHCEIRLSVLIVFVRKPFIRLTSPYTHLHLALSIL